MTAVTFYTDVFRFALCGSRKYPYPHHGGNWKLQRGGGFKSAGNSRRVGGLTVKLTSRWFSLIQD